MIDSPTKSTCTGGGVFQRKGDSVTRREMGIHAKVISRCPSHTFLHHELWSRTQAELPPVPSAWGCHHECVLTAFWHSPLHSTLCPSFPFCSHFSSQEKGRCLMNCKRKWGTSSMLLLETKLGITKHPIKHFDGTTKWEVYGSKYANDTSTLFANCCFMQRVCNTSCHVVWTALFHLWPRYSIKEPVCYKE